MTRKNEIEGESQLEMFLAFLGNVFVIFCVMAWFLVLPTLGLFYLMGVLK